MNEYTNAVAKVLSNFKKKRQMKRLILFLIFTPFLYAKAQSGWDTVGVRGFGMSIESPFVKVSPDGTLFMVVRSGQGPTVWKFDGNSWVHTGQAPISGGDGMCTTMAFDSFGTPYVAFMDQSYGRKATVMKFDGTNWIYVGSPGITQSAASCTSIDIDANGTPYITFRDVYYDYRASVMKYDGNSWVYVGSPGFSTVGGVADGAIYTSIAFDKNNVPFIAYSDMANSYKATVQKYDGTNWVYVGVHGFANWNAQNTRSMVFDKNNVPYIVVSVANKARVMKYDGSNWMLLGNALSQGYTEFAQIAIDNNDKLFVVYTDYVNGQKATVKTFDGTKWVAVGDTAFSAAQVYNTTLDLDNKGNLYVGFTDCSTPDCWWATVMKHSYTLVDLQEEKKSNSFNIYPNPTNSRFTVSYTGKIANISLNVKNQLGQLIFSKQFPSSNTLSETIDLTSKSKGVYFVEVISDDEKQVRKIIIE